MKTVSFLVRLEADASMTDDELRDLVEDGVAERIRIYGAPVKDFAVLSPEEPEEGG